MGGLSLRRDLALVRIHVIQSVIGADRAGVRGCPSGVRPRCHCRLARRAFYLTAECDTGADADADQNDRTENGRSLPVHHFLLSQMEVLIAVEATRAGGRFQRRRLRDHDVAARQSPA